MRTDRTSRLLAGVDVTREVGLEIGPLASPLVSRGEGRQIFYADYTNRESLREASRGNPHVDLDAIPEIDYIVSSPLPKDLGRKFDYILASHVIEHVPDLLGWLHALFGWLSPSGRVILAIPDKRYCFDYWRQLSTVGQVLEAFYEARPRPPFHAIYDGFSQAVRIDTARAWQEVPYQDVLAPMFSKATALALAREAHETGCYRDCHCWVFTYHSFLQLIAELNELGVGGIRLLDHSAPVTYSNEFQATLAPMRGQKAFSTIGGTPLSSGSCQVASGDAERLSGESTSKTARRAGTLLRASGSKFGDRVFFCARGRRHWVIDVRWMTENGFSWPKDVIEVPPEVLETLMPARAAALAWDEAAWLSPPRSSIHEMRELCVSRLRGRGYEIGPGASPMPIPLDCDVKYIDAFDCATLKELAYSGQDTVELIEPDIVTEFEDLSEIPEQSADFFVGAHVIEHTRNPIGCMVQAYRRLRRGGYLVLVVPDITRTFDRDRALTSLDHLIEDYEHPDHERDSTHFKEFYTKAFPIGPEEFEATWRTHWQQRSRIHYHTWTYESFRAMVDYISRHLCRFDEVWSQPTLDVEGANEFYFALRK